MSTNNPNLDKLLDNIFNSKTGLITHILNGGILHKEGFNIGSLYTPFLSEIKDQKTVSEVCGAIKSLAPKIINFIPYSTGLVIIGDNCDLHISLWKIIQLAYKGNPPMKEPTNIPVHIMNILNSISGIIAVLVLLLFFANTDVNPISCGIGQLLSNDKDVQTAQKVWDLFSGGVYVALVGCSKDIKCPLPIYKKFIEPYDTKDDYFNDLSNLLEWLIPQGCLNVDITIDNGRTLVSATNCKGPFGLSDNTTDNGYLNSINNIALDVYYANCCPEGKVRTSSTSMNWSDHEYCYCGDSKNKPECCFTVCSALGCETQSPVNQGCKITGCPEDQVCDTTLSIPTCKPKKDCISKNNQCYNTVDCCSGLTCENSVCLAPSSSKSTNKALIIGGSILGGILLIGIIVILIMYFRKKNKN